MMEKFKDAFRVEALDLLNQLEGILLEIEAQPKDEELLASAFRAMHTIKGSSGMFGFESINKFAHEVENILDQLRSGKLVINKQFIDLTLKARDHIRLLLDEDGPLTKQVASEGNAILEGYKQFAEAQEVASEDVAEEDAGAQEQKELEDEYDSPVSYRIQFKPNPDVFINGTKPLVLLKELSSLGECSILPNLKAVPPLSEINPELCYSSWECILTTRKSINAVRDVFIFVEGACDFSVQRIEDNLSAGPSRGKKLGEILVERGLAEKETINSLMGEQKRIGEILVENNIVSETDIASALAEQDHLKRVKEKQQQEGVGASLRVSSEKLDSLVDLVGELVTLQARLAQTSSALADNELTSIVELSDRLISQLRDNTMSIRMLPIGSTFSKFKRVVRDLSGDLSKEIELATEGAETELDKTVIERLNDPLVHIIRNSVDHGIELPAQRLSQGKPRQGTITLSAKHSGAYVLIQVQDDGRGLDKDAIYAKAVEKGLVRPGSSVTDQDLYQMIFAPGFSTAQKVTSVSGRGVGMDVVKREIDTLGGTVLIATEKGKGTTITLKLPLTLAIIDGLLVSVGGENYVFPLSAVDGCIELSQEEKETRGEKKIAIYRNEILPYVELRSVFSVQGEAPGIEQIVIVNAQEARVGFVVDEVIGDYQTVIKPLGRMYKDAEGLAGATILGDGTVALILDVNRLALLVQREETRKRNEFLSAVGI